MESFTAVKLLSSLRPKIERSRYPAQEKHAGIETESDTRIENAINARIDDPSLRDSERRDHTASRTDFDRRSG